ncbi:hypothetical protein GCM10009122_23460 [Fulvivirga kasyanovii]|uniref:Uncharacterized protein n=1 Tax=Fulvivirga kasyanovii TaxID=396812 RepID=A0ABW9RXG2_9BACT|nr:hypothetical protein [Fulvivirga kasyanovii]MTI28949.1 hypothetical protein [Fulvivirga kasyanovii]
MNFEELYWSRLINHWVRVKGRNGLTIPFILGVRTLIDNDFKIMHHCVTDLFTEIRNSDSDEVITLQHCENIGEYVLGLNDPTNGKDGLLVPDEKTGKTKIIATLNTQVLGKTFEEIIKSLQNRYSDCLTNGTFSRVNFKWTEFSESDLKMIDEALHKT